MLEIIEPLADLHTHTFTFSDGMNSVDEMVVAAGLAGLKRMALTDHSLAHQRHYGLQIKTLGANRWRWRNIHNDVKVLWGVEADIISEDGEVCFESPYLGDEVVILSLHEAVYSGSNGTDLREVTKAYVMALEKYHERITSLGHICAKGTSEYLDVPRVLEVARNYGIYPELNCANLVFGKTDLKKLDILLRESPKIHLNSDAHNVGEMQGTLRRAGFEYLRAQGLIL
jgi:histidinol phosphatase-like PHP family hydrolase